MILSKSTICSSGGDENLIDRARAGDRSAQEELAATHRHSAYLLALHLLGNQDDALDIAQDAMLRFFSSLNRFDRRRPVKPWLFQIVRNCVHDLRRRRRVRLHQSLDSKRDDDQPYSLELVDATMDPERDAKKAQLRAKVWHSLSKLSPAMREILVLRDYHDLSYSEIAATLCIPLGTVMSRLHGARKQLRQVVQEDLRSLIL